MGIQNSSLVQFFKNFEKKAANFYEKSVKGRYNNFKLMRKIKGLLKFKERKALSSKQKSEINTFYKKYGLKSISTLWHWFYSDCNGTFSVEYIPENLFYLKIEPSLNLGNYYPALADKNLLDKLFPKIKQPETVIKHINGYFYHKGKLVSLESAIGYCKDCDEDMIIKPTVETWGGNNIRLISNTDDKLISEKLLRQLFFDYGKNFIIQKKLQQHESISALNPTSLNTFRVISYFTKNGIKILSIVIRIGRKGSITDNSSTGGVSCGVQRDGNLNDIGYQLSGQRVQETDSGIKFKNVKLPFVEKIERAAMELHKSSPYFRVISWDFALDQTGGVVLIEYNILGQGINLHQLNNGPVLAPLLEEL